MTEKGQVISGQALKIIAGAFENNIGNTGRYHAELLKRMIVTIRGVRPAFLSEESFRLLDNLRAFRHLLRHAYMYDLDEKKVRLVLGDARRLGKIYKRDVKAFVSRLK